ncbi:acyl-CoA dehydrogenase [Kitasatospora sp. MMS16-BH015]|uniref:acyl-CoA dehydrogenase family protein n=1 Tax=Kitasatospora sp. MMS16-BH015 TaxID=2018025 RepID=UPI000CA31C32|nr:acyl-CoA dehydrogenase family protein [Kitasatospora sp. MMS16-BH015]AUG75665.1 acyl-CoA dehydrogenase [Kitasatospora sp. MMS16-BH015]
MVIQERVPTATNRVAELEHLLGDRLGPSDVLQADERYELPCGGEDLLAEFGLAAEFVPVAEGGRYANTEELVQLLRPVFRRDFALGFGPAATAFAAALPVWAHGTPAQRAEIAGLLLTGGRIGQVEPDFAPEDEQHDELAILKGESGEPVLSGKKRTVHGLSRADALLVYARTDSGALRALLLGPRELSGPGVRKLPRTLTEGNRGGDQGGLYVEETDVEGADLGPAGQGMTLLLESLQITRAALPAMALGSAETALRTALGFTVDSPARNGQPLGEVRRRDAVAWAFADLLAADCLSSTATRALHLLPGRTSLLSAAAKYLAPQLMVDALQDLSAVLGAESFCTWGPYGMFGKAQRDLRLVHSTYPGTPCCLATILPQLAPVAQAPAPEVPAELFRLGAALEPLVYERLALAADGDPIGGELLSAAEEFGAEEETAAGPLGQVTAALAEEYQDFRRECRETAEGEQAAFALGERFALLQAAAACLGVWRHRARGGEDTFLAEPAWLLLALTRLLARLERPLRLPLTEAAELVAAEAMDRFHQPRSFDLHGTPLGG